MGADGEVAARRAEAPGLWGPGVVVLASLTLVAGRLVEAGAEDPFASPGNSEQFVAAHALNLAATVFVFGAALVLVGLLPESRHRGASMGAGLVALGVVGTAGAYALDFASVELAQAGRPQDMRSLFIAMLDNPGVRLLRGLEVGLAVGLLVLAWALWRGRAVGWPTSFVIAAGVLLSSRALPDKVGALGAVLLAGGLAAVVAPLLTERLSRKAEIPLEQRAELFDGHRS